MKSTPFHAAAQGILARDRRHGFTGLAALGEEVLEQGAAFIGQHATDELRVMIELVLLEEIDDGTAGSGFGIGRTEDDARQACMHHRAGTHDARLERDEEFATRQTIVAEYACGRPQSHDFGMRGRIVRAYRLVEAGRNDGSILDHHGTDRDFAQGPGITRLVQRLPHEDGVLHR